MRALRGGRGGGRGASATEGSTAGGSVEAPDVSMVGGKELRPVVHQLERPRTPWRLAVDPHTRGGAEMANARAIEGVNKRRTHDEGKEVATRNELLCMVVKTNSTIIVKPCQE